MEESNLLKREALVILIETNTISWKEMKELTLKMFFDQLFLYLKQMILADVFLPPTFIAYNEFGANFLYPSPEKAKKFFNLDFLLNNNEEIHEYFLNILQEIQKFNLNSNNEKK